MTDNRPFDDTNLIRECICFNIYLESKTFLNLFNDKLLLKTHKRIRLQRKYSIA